MDTDFGWVADEAARKSASIEYRNFSTSLKLPEYALKEEENAFKSEGIIGKMALKTAIAKKIREAISQKIGKPFELDGEVNFRIDLDNRSVDVEIRPIFLLCKYKKLERGISQTRWEKYGSSVEGYIVDAAVRLFGATNAFLHGAGREDVDVRMLGDGRICTVEITGPTRRSVGFSMLEGLVRELSKGSVELYVLREASREHVWIVKEAHFDKEYEAVVEFGKKVSEEGLARVLSIKNIEQRTPVRVQHRRADLVRKKKVLFIKIEENDGKRVKFRIKTEAGTYIKELISGDGGRTRPSFAEAAGCSASCIALDVIKVHEYISDWW
ncbi:MAG: tRNA pseudouridine(54/55) synthase Pus10 [Candidatus Micrarchaeota archaeon]|nr:tRNA pseudouridine(54/55) synthase Pus10 [Candidatus Micrarchaeota archaeon]